MKKNHYTSPELEELLFVVENGFGGSSTGDPDDDGNDKWTDSGQGGWA